MIHNQSSIVHHFPRVLTSVELFVLPSLETVEDVVAYPRPQASLFAPRFLFCMVGRDIRGIVVQIAMSSRSVVAKGAIIACFCDQLRADRIVVHTWHERSVRSKPAQISIHILDRASFPDVLAGVRQAFDAQLAG